jgi:capsular polysaccharide biosynthesis protein
MRNLENVSINFCWYVVKKYIFLLGIAVVAATVVGGILSYKNRTLTNHKSFYTVFSIKSPLSVIQTPDQIQNAYDITISLQNTGELVATGCLNSSQFAAVYNEKFMQKTGRKLSEKITVTFSSIDALIIGKISSVDAADNQDAELLANIIADKGAEYLTALECIDSVQILDRASEKDNFTSAALTARIVKPRKNTGKLKALIGVPVAIFIVMAVFGICFVIELRRDPVISEEDVQNVTGKEVFCNLDKPLAVAAGRNIMQALNGDKIITLVGNLSADKVKQLVFALKMDNINVSSVYISDDIPVGNSTDILKSQNISTSADAENKILLNSKIAADNADGFYKLLDQLAQKSEIVISGIDSTWNVPKLLPPAKSKVIICAVKGKTGNRELAELTTALRLCGTEVIGAII